MSYGAPWWRDFSGTKIPGNGPTKNKCLYDFLGTNISFFRDQGVGITGHQLSQTGNNRLRHGVSLCQNWLLD